MSVKLKPLNEQTIVVTGATSGNGLAIARRATEAGARVILVARDAEDLRNMVSEIERDGGRADYVAADIGFRDQVRNVVETVVNRYGGFDTWVNDAGVGAYAKLEDISDKDHERSFQTNYWGVVYGSTEALKHLKNRGGALINMGSIASDMPTPLLSSYAASKHAVKGFTNSLRLELMHENAPVSVTLIKPSGIATPFPRHAANYMDTAASLPPPMYHPDQVARAVLRAAERPLREVTVGGAGALQIAFFQLCPTIADKVIELIFFASVHDPSRPKGDNRGLHEPGDGGHELGDQSGYVRRTSLYTSARTHPLAMGGLVLAATAGLAVLAAIPGMQRSRH